MRHRLTRELNSFSGNVTTCGTAGFASDVQIGPGTNVSASDANVAGTVLLNAGTIQPGQGQEVNIAITGAGVMIDAVVVKGGSAYNVYSNGTVVPPTCPLISTTSRRSTGAATCLTSATGLSVIA